MKYIVDDLRDLIPCMSMVRDNYPIEVEKVSELESNEPYTLTWCSYENTDKLAKVKDKIVIIDARVMGRYLNNSCNYIYSYNPRQSFAEALKLFDTKPKSDLIGQNVVIEEGVEMGENVRIGHNTVIMSGTKIGNNVTIGCNCTIGGVGFGYEKNDNGVYELIPHLGGVIIHNNVDIGNNTCIDKGVIGYTSIGSGTKIDNLVHIAHGVKIGSHCMIIANSMIAGSVIIDRDSWIAPSSSILNKKKLGYNSVIGMGAVVIRDVESNTTVVGNPAKPLKK